MGIKDYWKPILGVAVVAIIIIAIAVPLSLNSKDDPEKAVTESVPETEPEAEPEGIIFLSYICVAMLIF